MTRLTHIVTMLKSTPVGKDLLDLVEVDLLREIQTEGIIKVKYLKPLESTQSLPVWSFLDAMMDPIIREVVSEESVIETDSAD